MGELEQESGPLLQGSSTFSVGVSASCGVGGVEARKQFENGCSGNSFNDTEIELSELLGLLSTAEVADDGVSPEARVIVSAEAKVSPEDIVKPAKRSTYRPAELFEGRTFSADKQKGVDKSSCKALGTRMPIPTYSPVKGMNNSPLFDRKKGLRCRGFWPAISANEKESNVLRASKSVKVSQGIECIDLTNVSPLTERPKPITVIEDNVADPVVPEESGPIKIIEDTMGDPVVPDLETINVSDSEDVSISKFGVPRARMTLKSYMLDPPKQAPSYASSVVDVESMSDKSSRTSGVLSGPISLTAKVKPVEKRASTSLSQESHKDGTTTEAATFHNSELLHTSIMSPTASKTAALELSQMFPALANMGIIEDVLSTIGDSDEAFEKLQLLQDEKLAAQSQESPFGKSLSPVPAARQISWDEKLALLADQFPEMPSEKINRLLTLAEGNFLQAKALLSTENEDLQRTLKHDRALAEELHNGYISQKQGVEDWTERSTHDMTEIQKLCALFPSVSLDAVHSAFHISGQNTQMAIEVLQDGFDCELAIPPNFNSTNAQNGHNPSRSSVGGAPNAVSSTVHTPGGARSSRSSRSHSPDSRRGSRLSAAGSSVQDVYLVARQPVRQIQADIDDLKERRDLLRASGQHLAAATADTKIRSLIWKVQRLNNEADHKIFRHVNNDKTMSIDRPMDLHGQHVKTALSLLHAATTNAIQDQMQDTDFGIVTGRGNSSVDNVPKVKNQVIEYLEWRGIPWHYDGTNDGKIMFHITHQKPLKPYHSPIPSVDACRDAFGQ